MWCDLLSLDIIHTIVWSDVTWHETSHVIWPGTIFWWHNMKWQGMFCHATDVTGHNIMTQCDAALCNMSWHGARHRHITICNNNNTWCNIIRDEQQYGECRSEYSSVSCVASRRCLQLCSCTVSSADCCSVNDVLGRYRQSLGVVMSMGAALKEHYGL